MDDLETFRRSKDDYFRTGHSPLTEEQRSVFRGLRYYPEAPALIFDVIPEPFEDQDIVQLQTSTGETQPYLRWARVALPIEDSMVSLTLFRSTSDGELFVPFQDSNAGGMTYGAGRYVDAEEIEGGLVRIDFNYAYNPYCAYNDEWSCPLPPPENRLRVAIEAGEQTFDH